MATVVETFLNLRRATIAASCAYDEVYRERRNDLGQMVTEYIHPDSRLVSERRAAWLAAVEADRAFQRNRFVSAELKAAYTRGEWSHETLKALRSEVA